MLRPAIPCLDPGGRQTASTGRCCGRSAGLGPVLGKARGTLELGLVDVTGSLRARIGPFESLLPDLAAAIAGADDPKLDAVVRSEDLPRGSGSGGTSARNSLRSASV